MFISSGCSGRSKHYLEYLETKFPPKKYLGKKMTLMTWNINLLDQPKLQRAREIAEVILTRAPDFVLFQESFSESKIFN